MAVTASLRDRDGQIIDAKIVSLTAAIAAMPTGAHGRYALAAQVEQAQVDAVNHYIRLGRISAATILSTLS